jgi:hypothetical protein
MENCTCASFYTVRGVHKKDCPAFTPPSTTRSDAEVQRIKSLYRGVVNLDVEPNRYEFPNYEAADKAIDELIRRIAAQERQAGRDEAWQLPEHKASFHLMHNEHKACYEPIEQYVERHYIKEDLTPEMRQRIIEADSIWELQWYPNTPVGFNKVVGSTLQEVLAAARSPKDGETRV